MKIPTQCRLWKKKPLTDEDLSSENFDSVRTFIDTEHFSRSLLKCKECGQLYFNEWWEKIDWINGNDPQYQTLIPIETEDETKLLEGLSALELMKYPRIQWDWPVKEGQPAARWASGFAGNKKFEKDLQDFKQDMQNI